MSKGKLGNSFFLLFLVYFIGGWVIYGFTPPSVISEALQSLPPYLGKLAGEVSDDPGRTDDLLYMSKVFVAWSLPVLALVLAGLSVGVIAAWAAGGSVREKHQSRIATTPEYRDGSISIGPMMQPLNLRRKRYAEIEVPGVEINEQEQSLLNAIFDVMHAYKVSAGEAHGVSLIDHTLNVINESIQKEGTSADVVLAAAAHDLAKLRTHKDFPTMGEGGGSQGIWSGRILAGLPEYWDLPEDQRERVLLAVKYSHEPKLLPQGFPQHKRVRKLMGRLRISDQVGTATEKAATGEDRIAEWKIIIEIFLSNIHTLPWREGSSQGGRQYVGMRKEGVLFIFRDKLEEKLAELIPEDQKVRFSETAEKRRERREKNKTRRMGNSPLITHFLKGCELKGWLIRSVAVNDKDAAALPVQDAFWSIQSGKQKFENMILLRLDADMVRQFGIESVPWDVVVDTGLSKLRQIEKFGSAMPVSDRALSALSTGGQLAKQPSASEGDSASAEPDESAAADESAEDEKLQAGDNDSPKPKSTKPTPAPAVGVGADDDDQLFEDDDDNRQGL